MSNQPRHPDARQQAALLNRDCQCGTLDLDRLRAELAGSEDPEALFVMLTAERPYLFAPSPVFIPAPCLERQRLIIEAIEQVIALPAFQARVLAYAPATARHKPKARGAFLGYDFHLGAAGPRLIEINTNAGGGLLNALLPRVHRACCEIAEEAPGDRRTESAFLAMIREEWRLERGDEVLGCVAIVDDQPETQFLYPEFLLFRDLFRAHGVDTYICDPGELETRDGRLWYGSHRIDLIYNRLTDFSLEQAPHQGICDAYLNGQVVLTPHPHAHALYADKRNLALLTDDRALQSLGVDDLVRRVLIDGIAHTEVVQEDQVERFWTERRQFFFKPAAGYGSRAAYRGDKLTKRVFQEILQACYVAQALVMPSERHLEVEGELVNLKVDLRNFVYQGQVQSVASRMYQGQTTNLRTPGGGFAPVVVIPDLL